MVEKRIQKILSECGVSSRRKAEELIELGRVKVNGRVAKLGQKADIYNDIIMVDGKKISKAVKLYILLNKPRGYVTTMKDEKNRKCVADLITDIPHRVYPVGRLDRDSEGFLLLTNDGDFANALIHPAKHVPKVYKVVVDKLLTEEQLFNFEKGVLLEGEKEKTAPARIKLVSYEQNEIKNKERVVAKVTLFEGKNRQIRRMFEHFGANVTRLKRLSIGGIELGQLSLGKWRELEEQEKQLLFKSLDEKRSVNKKKKGKRV